MYADVDYVRVYQPKSRENRFDCSPADLPTKPIIDSIPKVYKWPSETAVDDEVALAAVLGNAPTPKQGGTEP